MNGIFERLDISRDRIEWFGLEWVRLFDMDKIHLFEIIELDVVVISVVQSSYNKSIKGVIYSL